MAGLPLPRIVLETDRILVINKHANYALNANQPPHAAARHTISTQRNGYFHHVKTVLLDDRPGTDLYPCHRLDRPTSGCLLLAKDVATARHLGILFSSSSKQPAERVNKTYVALSSRKPKKKMGRIVGDMDKGRRGSWKLTRTTVNPAITTFQSFSYVTDIGSTETNAIDQRLYYFIVRPHTGRTHQIRVALKSVGAPILGDERYANANDARHIDRAYLHSAAMSFTLPGDELIDVVCPPFDEDGIYFADDAFRTMWNDTF